ncbi:MAG: multiple sugar transport system substrate-binding protein [Mycobacteriales bacterium]|jgi:multiple sugar transport system substrate-binding protein
MNRRHIGWYVAAMTVIATVWVVPAVYARPAQRPSDSEGPITFVDGTDTSRGGQMAQLVKRWNEGHLPNEQVDFVQLATTTDEQRAQEVAWAQDAAAHPGPAQRCPDVFTMDVLWTAEFARAGYVEALDPAEFDVAGDLPAPVRSATYDGKLWAIPLRTDVGLLYYRKDVLAGAGAAAPTTWAELVRQARTIAPRYGMAGYIGQLRSYEGLTVNVLEAMWGQGGDVLSPSGEVTVTSPAARAGIALLADGLTSGWIPRASLDYNEELSRDAFEEGHALFLRNWPYVLQILDSPGSPVAKRVGVAPLPGPSALGGWNLGISRCSRSQATAKEFIKFLVDNENQRILLDRAGYAPVRAALYTDAELRHAHPYLDAIRQSLTDARTRPVTPYYREMTAAIQSLLHAALANPKKLDAALTALDADLRAATTGR